MDQTFYSSQENWDKLHHYAREAYDKHKSEIGGMLVAVEDKDGDWILEDPVILKQEISMTNCVLDKHELAKYYSKAGVKHKDSNFRFVWWHSHHTMDAFWSGTDLTAIKEYSDGDFSFALVINLKGDHVFRVSSWKPFEMHIDTEVEVIKEEKLVPKKISNEVNKLCSKLTYTSKYVRGNYNTTYYNNRQQSLLSSGVYREPNEEYTTCLAMITSANFKYAAGEWTFAEWTTAVGSFNNQLENFYIDDALTERELKKMVIHKKSEDFIEPLIDDWDSKPIDKKSENDMDQKEEESYMNQIYGSIY